MSLKNGHRAKAQIERKKKVLQRIRTRELKKSLAAKSEEASASQPTQAAPQTQDVE